MKSVKKPLGFSIVEGFLILVLVGLVGLIGYKVYSTRHMIDKQNSQASTSTQTATTTAPTAPAISSTKDLTAAEQTLDKVNPDDNNTDLSQLSSQASGF